MITIIPESEIQQGTQEWKELRSKYITGTDAYSILRGKTIEQIIEDKKKNINSFSGNYYTRRGHILEDESRDIYSKIYQKVETAGFILNDKYPLAGYSPDGLIGEHGLWENKSFLEKKHLQTYNSLSPQIIAQTQFGIFVSERDYVDLTLYNPDVEDVKNAYLIKRIHPINSFQDKFKKIFSINS